MPTSWSSACSSVTTIWARAAASCVLGAGELRAGLEHLLLDAGELGAVLLDLLRQLDRLGALQVLDPLLEAGVLGLELLDATLAAECHDRCPFPAWRLTLRVRSDYTRRSTEPGLVGTVSARSTGWRVCASGGNRHRGRCGIGRISRPACSARR